LYTVDRYFLERSDVKERDGNAEHESSDKKPKREKELKTFNFKAMEIFIQVTSLLCLAIR
jgi:hypothetical protein